MINKVFKLESNLSLSFILLIRIKPQFDYDLIQLQYVKKTKLFYSQMQLLQHQTFFKKKLAMSSNSIETSISRRSIVISWGNRVFHVEAKIFEKCLEEHGTWTFELGSVVERVRSLVFRTYRYQLVWLAEM